MLKFLLCAGAACLSSAVPALGHAEGCDDLMPAADRVGDNPPRSLTVDDLVRVRDIGPVSTSDITAPILSVSPDGRQMAFQMRRADPASNSYCLGMYVLDLHSGVRPVQVDTGGEFLRVNQSLLGVTNYPSGYTLVVTPKWSPDGNWIAFLKRTGDHTQVWRARADGTSSEAVTHLDFDVEDFAWSTDGRFLIISGRPDLAAAVRAVAKEGEGGYLYDDRYVPFAGNRPFPRDTVPVRTYRVSVDDPKLATVSEGEGAQLKGDERPAPTGALLTARSDRGRAAWTVRSDPGNVVSTVELHAKGAGLAEVICSVPACGDIGIKIKNFWWSSDGKDVYFLREAWNRSRASLFRWSVKTGQVARLLETEDALIGCQMAADALVCAQEASRQPRRLVRIDLSNGNMTTLFDPNPEFASIKLGAVRRLYWTNAFGISNFGDLVLPPDAEPGRKYPLVVVQYETRGFLRGGTDDEYPIFLFAAHGLAVLSFQHPDSVAYTRGASSWDAINRANFANWTDRRNVQSSLEAGLAAAEATGQVDATRMGVTGLSEGASMVQWAILNSHLFKAAVSSSCCDDVVTTVALSGPAGAEANYDAGYPRLTDKDQTFWRPYSFVLNAARMDTPLLLQSADSEYLSGLESVTALRELHKPVELYVYPDEFHEKWQPVHRQAIYRRNLDWFDFWLRDVEDSAPLKQAQYARWRAMKADASKIAGGTPGP